MAVIGRIRQKTGLLLILVLGALVLFLLQGLFSGSASLSREDLSQVGEVNGNEISINEFNAEYKNEETAYILQNNQNLPKQQETYYRNRVWENLVKKYAYQDQLELLGIVVTSDSKRSEQSDMFEGTTIPKELMDNFTDEQTGEFSPARLQSYLAQINSKQQGQSPEIQKERVRWALYSKSLIENRLYGKYYDLVEKSTYVPSYWGKKKYMETQQTSKFNYLFVPYQSIPDSIIKDAELNLAEYLDKNKAKYKARATVRKVDYINFAVIPSATDSTNIKNEVDKIYADFQTSEDDTMFVQTYADNPVVPRYKRFSELPFACQNDPEISDSLDQVNYGPTNKVYPPTLLGSIYNMEKITDVIKDSLFTMEASQIIFDKKNPNIEELLDTLKKGMDFGTLADQMNGEEILSNPQFSKFVGAGGELRNLKDDSDMLLDDTEFRDKLFALKTTGLHPKVIETSKFKYIVFVKRLKTFEKLENKFLHSTIDKALLASEATRTDIYTDAQYFLRGCGKTKEGFYAKLKSDTLEESKETAMISQDYPEYVNGIQDDGHQVMRWAFKNDVEVKPQLFSFKENYIVAVINGEDKKGEVGSNMMDDGRVKMDAIREKKAEIIIENLGPLLHGSMIEIAENYNSTFKLGELPDYQRAVQRHVENHVLSSNKVGNAQEPKVIGRVFGLPKDTRSEPFAGESGVYIVEVLDKNDGKEREDGVYTQEVDNLRIQLSNRNQISRDCDNLMKDNAEIKDYRYRHF